MNKDYYRKYLKDIQIINSEMIDEDELDEILLGM